MTVNKIIAIVSVIATVALFSYRYYAEYIRISYQVIEYSTGYRLNKETPPGPDNWEPRLMFNQCEEIAVKYRRVWYGDDTQASIATYTKFKTDDGYVRVVSSPDITPFIALKREDNNRDQYFLNTVATCGVARGTYKLESLITIRQYRKTPVVNSNDYRVF